MGSIGNIIGGRWEGSIWSFNKCIILHFDDEQDMHTSSDNYRESVDNFNLDLLIILH